jgi:hypothetical protein
MTEHEQKKLKPLKSLAKFQRSKTSQKKNQVTLLVLHLFVCCRSENRHALGMFGLVGKVEWCQPKVISDKKVCSGLDENCHVSGMTVFSGHVKGCSAFRSRPGNSIQI